MRKPPGNEQLQAAISYWPKEHQEMVETLLYNNALQCAFWTEYVYEFIIDVVDKNIEKWDQEGAFNKRKNNWFYTLTLCIV